MCGRYTNFLAHQDLVDAFTIATIADGLRRVQHCYEEVNRRLPDDLAAAIEGRAL